jgi:hypothetical protein
MSVGTGGQEAELGAYHSDSSVCQTASPRRDAAAPIIHLYPPPQNTAAAGASRPGTASSTPGRPPRTPGTPAAGLGPLARHMDSFEVMESPAVREALAGRPQQPGTAGSSPAGSLVASPGFVSTLPDAHLGLCSPTGAEFGCACKLPRQHIQPMSHIGPLRMSHVDGSVHGSSLNHVTVTAVPRRGTM